MKQKIHLNKNTVAIITAIFGLAFVVTGCRERKTTSEAPQEVIEGAHYKKDQGLILPEETQKALGLQITEVTEEKIASSFTIPVQVYRSADKALANGNLSPEQSGQLTTGKPVFLKSQIATNQTAKGTLVSLQKSIHSAVDELEAIIEIQSSFPIGTILQATFTFEREEPVTVIPRSALLKTAATNCVYTVNGKYLLRTPVLIGAENEEFIEIKEGLYAGDKVAKEPVMALWLTELQAIKAGQSCCVIGH